jgi:hypothetical protein
MPPKRTTALAENSPLLLPMPVDVDLIRFEKNLLQIGFFGANETRGKGRTTRRVEQTVTRDGHKVKVAAEFRGSDALGLPSTTDRDKFIALLKIVSEDRARTGQIANPVRFSGYRLIQELGLARNGEIYEEILRWGKRMTDTTITSEQVVYFAAKKVYSDETLHVFRSFKRTGNSKLDGSERQEQYEVVLEDWLVENLNQRYVIPEDFNAYKQLTRPTAKGIFGNLHLWFHASQGRPVEKDYAELCNLLNVQAYPHLSKIRSTMGLALDELIKIKYVHKWDIEKMVSKRGFKVVLTPGEELLRILDNSRGDRRLQARAGAGQPEAALLKPGDEKAVDRLQTYGILPATSRTLVAAHGVERVAEVADYLDSQLQQPGSRKIANPAGLLIHSPENELPIPAWFTASRQHEVGRQEDSERAARRYQAEFEYAEWLNAQREIVFAERFTSLELEVRLEEIAAEQSQADPTLKRWSREAKRVYARDHLWRELRAALKLPGFEEWLLGAAQTSLF